MGAKIDANRLRTGNLHANDWGILDAQAEKFKKASILIDDRALTVPQIYNKCRSLIDSGVDLKLVVVDYNQQVGLDEDSLASGENNLSIARRLKRLALDFNVVVIALSQVARAVEYRKNKRPMLSDLRGNAVDGDGADLVIFLYRGRIL